MNPHRDRSFKGMKQLIKIAHENHNIEIDIDIFNDPKNNVLLSDSYYSLINGYQRALEIAPPGSERFQPGISLQELDSLFFLESNLSSSIFQTIISIEKRFKTTLQYVISKHMGVLDVSEYLNWNEKFYLSQHHNDVVPIIKKLSQLATGYYYNDNLIQGSPIPEKKDDVSESLKSHRAVGNVPPWILVNDLTFGDSIRWYQSLQPFLKQEVIYLAFPNINFQNGTEHRFSNRMNLEFVKISLKLLRHFRNGIAHGDLINKIEISPSFELHWGHISKLIDLNQIMTRREFDLGVGKNDLLSLYIVIYIMSDYRQFFLLKTQTVSILEMLNTIFNSVDISYVRRTLSMPSKFSERIENLEK